MAIYRDINIRCEKCNTIYEVEYPSFVRIPEDNNFKKELLSCKIHSHKCPNCQCDNFVPSPVIYCDDEKKIVIIGDTYDEAIGNRLELEEDFKGYKFYFAENPWLLTDIISAIDYNLDPLVLEFIKYDGIKYFELKTKKYQVENSFIDFSDEGYEMKLVLIVTDINGNQKEKELNITYKMYNNYVDKVERFKKGLDLSIISPVYVKKLYHLARNLEIDGAKESTYEFLQCRDEYGDAVLAFVQSFNKGKFKEGDRVGLVEYDRHNNCNVAIYYVDKIIHMTDYEYISEINDLPVATYKVNDFELETELDHKTELHNESLKEALENKFSDDNYDVLFDANVIVPMKLFADYDDILDIRKVNVEYEENDKTYYSLYLDKSDIKDDLASSELIVNFKTVLKYFFTVANQYDGIVINPDTDKYKLSIDRLFRLITNRIMTNHDLMKDFIDNASSEEIAFIGEDKYNLIKRVYSTDIGLAAIREEFNLTKEKADYMLDDGYGRIKRIIKSNELMNK